MNSQLFRSAMEETWSSINEDAERSRDSNLAGPKLVEWYKRLSNDEQELADRILNEWAHSPDNKKQFDALFLISEFRIKSALPSLQALAGSLNGQTAPEPRFLRLKVLRLIDELRQK